MAETEEERVVENILRNITRFINGLADENRNTRKKALEGITKEVLRRKPQLEPGDVQEIMKEILKNLLQILSDPVEKCRELSLCFMADCLKIVPEPHEFLSFVIPVVAQRLGQQDIVETSEEMRLSLVKLLLMLVESCKKRMGPYVDDMVKILQRTIVDPYPEVKKESCHCSSALAKAVPEFFHMQSETLIKPLLMSVSHQHSRVRVEVVKAIGDVIQYGNGKSVDDVVSHLAQRLFDSSPVVRAAVTQVVGHWLLDLMDRYSFHHKLIPLLLSSVTDEVTEIRAQADGLWDDVGVKYESENENDLKDQQDFPAPDPDHYPPGVEPPNLGCRKLIYHNFSKIAPGIVHDITDWVVATRIKSAHLLYTLMLNEGDNVTQHLEKVLGGMYRAATDDEPEVVKYVEKSAELVGYFVSPKVWCKMILDGVQLMQSVGSLLVLAAVIRGSEQSAIKPYLGDIVSVLTEPALCRVADAQLQYHLLSCIEALTTVAKDDCADISLSLFSMLITVLALQRADIVKDRVHVLLVKLADVELLEGTQDLYNRHVRSLLGELKESYVMWTQHSVERHIFDALLMEAGPVVGEILDDVIPMLAENLDPSKDPELRLKCFTLLSRLVMKADTTLNSHDKFGAFVVTVVRDMIIPNCVWKAGRVAKAIRTTAVSCLWALLQGGALNKDRLLEVMEELMTQLRSTLEDDNMSTRLVTCRVMTRILATIGASLDDHRLHNMYPELLKRLDDSNDDVRVAVTDTWLAYLACFQEGYKVDLYRAHLEAIYKGLLIHLDDPDPRIQDAVLEVLKKAGTIKGSMLLEEIEAVKSRHRSTKYCNALTSYVQELPHKAVETENGYS